MEKVSERILQGLGEKECRGLLHSIFLSAPIPIWISQKGRFKVVNHNVIENLGFTEEELLNMHPLDVVHPEDREKVRETALAMLRGEHVEPYVFRAVTKSGEIQWCIGT